jgi:hypothetical protein
MPQDEVAKTHELSPSTQLAAQESGFVRLLKGCQTVVMLAALQPSLDEAPQLDIGEPRFTITLLPPPGTSLHNQMCADNNSQHANGTAQSSDAQWQRAVDAFVGFQRVAAAAAGYLPPEPQPSGIATSGEPQQVGVQGSRPAHGPWRPYLAPVLVNRRITAADHFQDTRHIELDISGSGLAYDPGESGCPPALSWVRVGVTARGSAHLYCCWGDQLRLSCSGD